MSTLSWLTEEGIHSVHLGHTVNRNFKTHHHSTVTFLLKEHSVMLLIHTHPNWKQNSMYWHFSKLVLKYGIPWILKPFFLINIAMTITYILLSNQLFLTHVLSELLHLKLKLENIHNIITKYGYYHS